MKINVPETNLEALRAVAALTFAPLSDFERMAFAGVESPDPLVAYGDNGAVVIIDGDTVSFYPGEGDGVAVGDEFVIFRLDEIGGGGGVK